MSSFRNKTRRESDQLELNLESFFLSDDEDRNDARIVINLDSNEGGIKLK